jgi:hypothetical protein
VFVSANNNRLVLALKENRRLCGFSVVNMNETKFSCGVSGRMNAGVSVFGVMVLR